MEEWKYEHADKKNNKNSVVSKSITGNAAAVI